MVTHYSAPLPLPCLFQGALSHIFTTSSAGNGSEYYLSIFHQ